MRSYVLGARLASGIAGTLAVLCVAAFAARLSRRGMVTALVTLVPLFVVGWVSLRAFDDVRSEPFTLLLFWGGALLISFGPADAPRGALRLGAGLGAVAAAGVWNPKWPAESLILTAWFFTYLVKMEKRRAVLAVAAAALLPAAALWISLRAASLRDLFFFVVTYNAAFYRAFSRTAAPPTIGPFAFCSTWFWPWIVVLAAAALIARRRSREIALPLLLLVAGLVEIRFLYSYPRLWPQHFAMWGCSAAVIYGLLAGELAAIPRLRPVAVAAFAVLLPTVLIVHDLRALQRVDGRHWEIKRMMLARLRPGEAAWVRPEEMPNTVPAGSYYWAWFDDLTPFSLGYASQPEARDFLPQVREEELPPCRLLAAQLQGAPPGYQHVRLLDHRAVRHLPQSEQCMRRLWEIGALTRVGPTPIWEVREPPARR